MESITGITAEKDGINDEDSILLNMDLHLIIQPSLILFLQARTLINLVVDLVVTGLVDGLVLQMARRRGCIGLIINQVN